VAAAVGAAGYAARRRCLIRVRDATGAAVSQEPAAEASRLAAEQQAQAAGLASGDA
jgi:hypothetical protein